MTPYPPCFRTCRAHHGLAENWLNFRELAAAATITQTDDCQKRNRKLFLRKQHWVQTVVRDFGEHTCNRMIEL